MSLFNVGKRVLNMMHDGRKDHAFPTAVIPTKSLGEFIT